MKTSLPPRFLIFILVVMLISSCYNTERPGMAEVRISFPGENISNALVEFKTSAPADAALQYWSSGQEANSGVSVGSGQTNSRLYALSNLDPGTQYFYRLVTGKKSLPLFPTQSFRTPHYEPGKKDSFLISGADTTDIPTLFRDGFVLAYNREYPGSILVFDSRGNIVWHHQVQDAGFKVVQFTRRNTLLCLLGTRGFEKGNGNLVMELSLTGDTLLYLPRGRHDFTQTLHHEIYLDEKDRIVTLCTEERIMDLRSKGGQARDTVNGDGILVMDREGRRIWKWTVFDELDPLADEDILQHKTDWTHANSVAPAADGNYLVSYYNSGQIWKIDRHSGKLIWKLGRNGDFDMHPGYVFDQAHAVHQHPRGWIVLFDNGASRHLSRTMALLLEEGKRKAHPVISTWLPPNLFTDRMGSGYLVNDSTLLHCSSRNRTIVLTNLQGDLLWQLRSNRMVPYRALFIPAEDWHAGTGLSKAFTVKPSMP